jgi:hypothetical protein
LPSALLRGSPESRRFLLNSALSPAAKLVDYNTDPQYDHRVILFYDVLGWRNEIEIAGKQPEKIGNLRRLILQHSRSLRLPTASPVNVSTFSDNIVVSLKPGKAIPFFLREIAFLQLATATHGFLIRGGISVGDIIHDSEVVFGPGLNRAYELESTVAKFPRIVVDGEVIKNFDSISGFVSFEDNIYFLDPFRPKFIQLMLDLSDDGPKPHLREAGLPRENRGLKDVPGDRILNQVLRKLKARLKAPLADKEWEKVAWLYDRIAARLGIALATSYPRVPPSE